MLKVASACFDIWLFNILFFRDNCNHAYTYLEVFACDVGPSSGPLMALLAVLTDLTSVYEQDRTPPLKESCSTLRTGRTAAAAAEQCAFTTSRPLRAESLTPTAKTGASHLEADEGEGATKTRRQPE